MTAQTVNANGANLVPESQRFRRNTTIQVTFQDGKVVKVDTKPKHASRWSSAKNPLEDWPGWE